MTRSKIPLCLFEGEQVRHLGPLVRTRAVWDLRLGPTSPRELFLETRPDEAPAPFAWTRPELGALYGRPDESFWSAPSVLLLAGHQLLLDPGAADRLAALKQGERIEAGGEAVALRLSGAEARRFLESLSWEGAPSEAGEILRSPLGPTLHYWWESYELAAEILAGRLPGLSADDAWRRPRRKDWRGREGILLGPGAETGPGVILDAADGPVILDQGVQVAAGSYIQGPCYLGPDTRVKPLSQLLHGTFAGPHCRLGGEIEWTQFQGYANKQHHGFLGHAAVGEWVNLGAGVCNSDLKNNYSSIRVTQAEGEFDTGRRFLGCCLGDHVKVAIQGRINTGSVFEPFVNSFGAGFPPKYLPAFSWVGDGVKEIYDLDKALATAKIVMERRGREMTPALESLYRHLFETVAGESA
jgi:UDP-N-acetylglucosamine diphosphorylase/glucosamine-1-phosphate N-acetyltransferase